MMKATKEFDYLNRLKDLQSWAVEDVSKSIENKLVPDYLQSSYSFNIKRKEFSQIFKNDGRFKT